MASNRELTFRTMRKEFARFPNIDLVQPISLGQVGIYDGRRALFEWRTSLGALGINISPTASVDHPPLVNQVHTSGGAVDIRFDVDAKSLGSASFAFAKSYAIATQAIAMTAQGYDLQNLQQAITDAIHRGTQWNTEWVVVSQVVSAPAFSLLVSAGRRAQAGIATQIPVSGVAFNIADPTLNLVVRSASGMGLQSLAQQNVTPFFYVHKLKGHRNKPTLVNGRWTDTQWRLELYG